MTTEVFQIPKVGDKFVDADNTEFKVVTLFKVQEDQWLEYQSYIKQPFFLKVETFLQKFRPLN